jgi:uncharacterized membrane protein YbhN (UPF0104 family)
MHAHPGVAARAHLGLSSRRVAIAALVLPLGLASLYVLLPQLAGLDDTWERLDDASDGWLVAAVVLELGSYWSYVLLFRAVLARPPSPIGWRESWLITLAGVAATRLLATGGAGGIALTAWALRRSGQVGREVGQGMTAFMVLLYGVFMVALLVAGLGLRWGVFAGPAPWGLTVVPGAFGASVIVVALLSATVPESVEGWMRRHGGRVATRFAAVPSTVGRGVRDALRLLVRGDAGVAGAFGWWAFDVAVLWACLQAFGGELEPAAVVMAYFVGMLGNLLPLPGGVGGVDGGMIAALIGFGVAGGLAIAAVLAYRAFAFWLPTIPGTLAYLRLRRVVQRWSAGSAAAD